MPPRQQLNADREHIKLYDLGEIALDLENPRLIIPEGAEEIDVLKIMYEREALDELASSFIENGYFLEEPVVLVPAVRSGYVVIEGNRRVATLKLLLDEKLREKVGVTGWPKPGLETRQQLERIPAVLYANRDEVVPYLGFRHISGIKTWEPFQKARYVASLVNAGRTIPDIERSVGDRSNAVRRFYQSFIVFEQVTRDLEIPSRTLESSYSLLEVALSQSSIKKFLSIPSKLPVTKTELVVPEEKYPELREIVSWIFGDPTQRQERIITDSRQISQRLAPIIKDAEALAYLRKTRDLEGAYEFSGGELVVLVKALASIRRATQRALGLLPPYRQNTQVKEAIDGLQPLLSELTGTKPS